MSDGWFIFWLVVWLLGGGSASAIVILWRITDRVIVKERVNGKTQVIGTYWVREKKDKHTGIVYWVSILRTFKNPKPSSNVMDVDKSGRRWATCYKLEEEQYCWVKDEWEANGKKNEVLKSFVPFSVTDREVLMGQYKKSELKKPTNVWKEVLLPAVAILAPTILVIFLVVYWQDFTADGKEIARMNLEGQKVNLQIQQQNMKLMQAIGIKMGNTSFAQTGEVQEQQGVIVRADETPPVSVI
ncbi:MAG: hypothetical protein QW165_04530 [Candidatus Woesearchaeota archaeon]